jgi:transmembrane sensor
MGDTGMTISQKIVDEAAGWMVALQEKPDDAQCLLRFERWLDQSPNHREAWERLHIAWQAFGATAPVFEDTWKDAPREADIPRSYRPRRSGVMRRVGFFGAAAVAMLCLVMVAGPSLILRLEADHITATAESRIVTLEDGSVVHLAGASAIATDFKKGRRAVRLLAGEAFFEVTPDKSRPFTVDANGVEVTVLGTKFDVQTGGKITTVALAEGSVKATVESAAQGDTEVLAPGDLLTANRATGEISRTTIAVSDIATWRSGQIFVVNASIGSVVEQIRRYHPAWLSLPDSTLASRQVTGFYDLRQPDQALEALVTPYGGKVRHVSSAARIISRF